LEIPSEFGLIPPLVASGFVDLHSGHVSSAVFTVLRKLHPSKAVTSNPAPETAGQFATSVRLRCKRRGHLPFRRHDLPGALLVLAPGTVRAGARWPSLGSLRSTVRLRRVHFVSIRHAIPQGGMS